MIRRLLLLLAIVALGVRLLAQDPIATRTGGLVRLPLRATIEGLDGTVRENTGAGTWMVRLRDRAAVLDLAAMSASSGGREVRFSAPPVMRASALMLPADFFVDELGVLLDIDEAQHVVRVRRTAAGEPVVFPLLTERIIFVSGGAIHSIAPDGSGLTRLTPARGGASSPVVSQDGASIAYLVGTDIHVMGTDGADNRIVLAGTLPIFSLQFSPDPAGKQLLFVRNAEPPRPGDALVITRGDLVLINADGTDERQITRSAADETRAMPSFNADGSKIAYVYGKGSKMWGCTINADGTGETRLSSKADEVGICTAFAPKGGPHAGKVWYVLAHGANLAGNVRVADAAGKSEVAPSIFPAAARAVLVSGITFAPNGARVVLETTYAVPGKPNQFQDDLAIANADGSGVRRLTSAGGITPSFSPDGARLVYVNNGLLHVVGIDGTGYMKLTKVGSSDTPRWAMVR
jgi:Tol biopolymer transport system component